MLKVCSEKHHSEDWVGNLTVICDAFMSLFHIFIYFPCKLFFFPLFPSTNKSADGYDVMQIKSQGDNMTSPLEQNQYREQWTSDSPTKRQFPPLKMPKIYFLSAQSCMSQGHNFVPKLFYPHFKCTSPRRTTSESPDGFRRVSASKMKRLCKCKHMSVLSCEVIAIAWGEFPCWAIYCVLD